MFLLYVAHYFLLFIINLKENNLKSFLFILFYTPIRTILSETFQLIPIFPGNCNDIQAWGYQDRQYNQKYLHMNAKFKGNRICIAMAGKSIVRIYMKHTKIHVYREMKVIKNIVLPSTSKWICLFSSSCWSADKIEKCTIVLI